jgi:hypothetical protein
MSIFRDDEHWSRNLSMDQDLVKLSNALAAATAGMNGEDLSRHPEGKWSAAQVLEHLYLTYTGTLKGMTRCLDGGKPLATKPTLVQRVKAMAVVDFGYFPEGRKSPTLAEPRGMNAEEVKHEVLEKLAAMDEAISKCETKFGKGTLLLDHPVIGPLNARGWRRFHLAHGLHHSKQLEGLRSMVREQLAGNVAAVKG